MKCPKCAYIGFEESDRCKNCGYEFALAQAQPVSPELPIRAADDGGPLADLDLRQRSSRDAERPRSPAPSKPRLDLDRIIGAEAQTPDLPLFGETEEDAADLPPLVSAPAAPRRPLAVRRQTPQPAKIRRPEPPFHDRGSTLDLPLPGDAPRRWLTAAAASPESADVVPADPPRRIGAALLDVALLGSVHALTVYFTLRVCGLAARDWHTLPVLPLLAFFLLVDAGYLVAFTTAGGQTIGKMAFGLKVVRDTDEPVPPGLAATRALGAIASTLCLGAGLIPALTHADRRAVHDRLAGTHVVRLSA